MATPEWHTMGIAVSRPGFTWADYAFRWLDFGLMASQPALLLWAALSLGKALSWDTWLFLAVFTFGPQGAAYRRGDAAGRDYVASWVHEQARAKGVPGQRRVAVLPDESPSALAPPTPSEPSRG